MLFLAIDTGRECNFKIPTDSMQCSDAREVGSNVLWKIS